MMKLSASISKKVPIEGMQYSNYSCSAGIEVELPDGTALEEVVGQLKALNATLDVAVNEQVRSGSRSDADRYAAPANQEDESSLIDHPAAPEPEGEAAQDRATQPQLNFIRTLAMEHAQEHHGRGRNGPVDPPVSAAWRAGPHPLGQRAAVHRQGAP
jgi:hypothetical protein